MTSIIWPVGNTFLRVYGGGSTLRNCHEYYLTLFSVYTEVVLKVGLESHFTPTFLRVYGGGS